MGLPPGSISNRLLAEVQLLTQWDQWRRLEETNRSSSTTDNEATAAAIDEEEEEEEEDEDEVEEDLRAPRPRRQYNDVVAALLSGED